MSLGRRSGDEDCSCGTFYFCDFDAKQCLDKIDAPAPTDEHDHTWSPHQRGGTKYSKLNEADARQLGLPIINVKAAPCASGCSLGD